jgi:hypothetical protein
MRLSGMSLRQALIYVSAALKKDLEIQPLDSVYVAAAGRASIFVVLKLVSMEPYRR